MCVVIGLQSTGEANTESVRAELGEDGLDDFVSAPHITMRRCARPLNPGPPRIPYVSAPHITARRCAQWHDSGTMLGGACNQGVRC